MHRQPPVSLVYIYKDRRELALKYTVLFARDTVPHLISCKNTSKGYISLLNSFYSVIAFDYKIQFPAMKTSPSILKFTCLTLTQ